MSALRGFAIRIFVGYFLVLGASAYVALGYFGDAVKPAVRQTMEEMLVEEAHLLASSLEGDTSTDRLRAMFDRTHKREVRADIYGVKKATLAQRVYVTDRRGRVIFDSSGRDEGADYSRWSDVARTLRGDYGARSTHEPGPDGLSVLYVGAPIRAASGEIDGVVTVGKPAAQMDPFVRLARRRLLRSGAAVLAGSLGVGLLIALVLSRSVSRLAEYAKRVASGERPALPRVGGELRDLAHSVDTMRASLEGKEYVEKTIQTMAHELKSPLTAVVGAAELLEGPVGESDRFRFATQIGSEARRMQAIVERLLDLAILERRRALEKPIRIDLADLMRSIVRARDAVLSARSLTAVVRGSASLVGERLLLEQALSNLVDNATQFAERGSEIELTVAEAEGCAIAEVRNRGPVVPEFASKRVFERFYSLPRPDTERRSTGLGLPFVRQVAELHRGTATLENTAHGVVARLTLPCEPPSS